MCLPKKSDAITHIEMMQEVWHQDEIVPGSEFKPNRMLRRHCPTTARATATDRTGQIIKSIEEMRCEKKLGHAAGISGRISVEEERAIAGQEVTIIFFAQKSVDR